jgi:hypothetical protein
MKPILRFICIYSAVSLIAAIGLLVDTWPRYPTSPIEWGLLLVIALPVTVLGEWLVDGTRKNSLSRAIENKTRAARFAWLRIGYHLALYVLFAVCAIGLFYWLQAP